VNTVLGAYPRVVHLKGEDKMEKYKIGKKRKRVDLVTLMILMPEKNKHIFSPHSGHIFLFRQIN